MATKTRRKTKRTRNQQEPEAKPGHAFVEITRHKSNDHFYYKEARSLVIFAYKEVKALIILVIQIAVAYKQHRDERINKGDTIGHTNQK